MRYFLHKLNLNWIFLFYHIFWSWTQKHITRSTNILKLLIWETLKQLISWKSVLEQFANDSSHFLDMDTEAHLTERLYTGFIGFGNSGTFDLMEVMYF